MKRLGTRLECVGSSPRISGVYQDGAREFVGKDQDSPEDYRGFNHDGEKELQTRRRPRIKFKHRAKVWTMQWELAGSSLALHRRYREDR
ncbi:hypothetical protein B296_00017603 [Ensete ventricosum]|uniref:Uncharacterized protein n=1 Tax=Ensete ventricosum TaxID=4639 RepID=A0A427ANU4_ENSVE|nr:hypothetical protein B296_00017603 [Ensete ventricosum]